MACFGRNSCTDANYDCDMHMNIVSGVTEEQTNGCGCGCGCCCCHCGCNNCGAVGGANTTCGPTHYVTNSQCDCAETEETTCGCGCNTCSTCNTCNACD